MEINCELGGILLDKFPNLKVDVHNPDIMINIEIEKEYLYILKKFLELEDCLLEQQKLVCFFYQEE